jgi:hypothetical protein
MTEDISKILNIPVDQLQKNLSKLKDKTNLLLPVVLQE